MIITVTKKASANGAGNVVATGSGRQKTVRWDHSHSADWNFGNAAGTLAQIIGLGWSDEISHEVVTGSKHRFIFP